MYASSAFYLDALLRLRSEVDAAVAGAARADAVKVELLHLRRVAGAKRHGEMAEHLLVLEVLLRQGLFAGVLPGPALVLLALLFLLLGEVLFLVLVLVPTTKRKRSRQCGAGLFQRQLRRRFGAGALSC